MNDESELRIFLAPLGSGVNYKKSLENSLKYEDIIGYLTKGDKNKLEKFSTLFAWCNALGTKKEWDQINTNSWVLFCKEKKYIYAGKVFYKTHNPLLAENIWVKNKRGEIFEYIYFFETIWHIDIEVDEINDLANYQKGFSPQGFMYFKEEEVVVNNILARFESIESFLGIPKNLQEMDRELYTCKKVGLSEDDEGFPEGKEQLKAHLIRERSKKPAEVAKKRFKEKHGSLYCEICGFDFSKKYGEIGKDYIECHYTVPASDTPEDYKIKPKDIVLVCSNCHRMLHRRRPWLKKKELKKLLKTSEIAYLFPKN